MEASNVIVEKKVNAETKNAECEELLIEEVSENIHAILQADQ